MVSILLDGKKVSLRVREEIRQEVSQRVAHGHRPPHLCAVLVGENPASEVYVAHKRKDCEWVGMTSSVARFAENISQQELLSELHRLNVSDDTDGIIVQLPLPSHISKSRVMDALSPAKDVDGFHHLNFGRIGTDLPAYVPATPLGIKELLRRYEIDTKGMHIVVVGRSYLVGLPTSILLARGSHPGDATVTLTHRFTKNLTQHTRSADMVIVAVGKPGFITADMVKEGAIVIDVGITRVKDRTKKSGYALRGDVDFDRVAARASFITPVPNGVGPMTRAALLMNTLRAAKKEVFLPTF